MPQTPQILQQLNGTGMASPQMAALIPAINKAKQVMSAVKASQNPSAMVQQIIQSNPQAQQAMKMLTQYGGDVNGMVNALAQQRGIDPNELMKLLQD